MIDTQQQYIKLNIQGEISIIVVQCIHTTHYTSNNIQTKSWIIKNCKWAWKTIQHTVWICHSQSDGFNTPVLNNLKVKMFKKNILIKPNAE
jgi:hypothetical protein